MLSAENIDEDSVSSSDAAGFHRPRRPYFFAQRYALAYVDQMRSFAEAIHRGLPAHPSGSDGRMATVAALAAQNSLDANRTIPVDEIG
jgi:myo-inositol 2-dehydrogenase/D-chiro-inositol 1-dehydrogenase